MPVQRKLKKSFTHLGRKLGVEIVRKAKGRRWKCWRFVDRPDLLLLDDATRNHSTHDLVCNCGGLVVFICDPEYFVGGMVPKGKADHIAYVSDFLEEAKASGLIKHTIDQAKP